MLHPFASILLRLGYGISQPGSITLRQGVILPLHHSSTVLAELIDILGLGARPFFNPHIAKSPIRSLFPARVDWRGIVQLPCVSPRYHLVTPRSGSSVLCCFRTALLALKLGLAVHGHIVDVEAVDMTGPIRHAFCRPTHSWFLPFLSPLLE